MGGAAGLGLAPPPRAQQSYCRVLLVLAERTAVGCPTSVGQRRKDGFPLALKGYDLPLCTKEGKLVKRVSNR